MFITACGTYRTVNKTIHQGNGVFYLPKCRSWGPYLTGPLFREKRITPATDFLTIGLARAIFADSLIMFNNYYGTSFLTMTVGENIAPTRIRYSAKKLPIIKFKNTGKLTTRSAPSNSSGTFYIIIIIIIILNALLFISMVVENLPTRNVSLNVNNGTVAVREYWPVQTTSGSINTR